MFRVPLDSSDELKNPHVHLPWLHQEKSRFAANYGLFVGRPVADLSLLVFGEHHELSTILLMSRLQCGPETCLAFSAAQKRPSRLAQNRTSSFKLSARLLNTAQSLQFFAVGLGPWHLAPA